jgi:capsular exopolysaccharide synthesis family protein
MQLVESVDATRSMVLHAVRAEALRVILITSAMGGEGKTSLSSHLAVSFARSGRRVVLVDSDLRRPAVHRVFGVNKAPGLSDLVGGKASVDEVVQGTWVEGLWVISAGCADPQSFDALAGERVRPILDELRAKFDMVVVDSCPVLPVADVLLIAPHVDGVIFSVLQEVSRLPAVHTAWNRLAWLGTRMLGVVVSGAPDGASYGYY